MKKWWLCLAAALFLTGCGAEETFETVSDVYAPVETAVREIVLVLPAEAAAPVLESADGGTLYSCGSYEILVEILPGGNVDGTVQTLTGLSSDRLTVLETSQQGCDRYDFTWCAAGENGDWVGRGAILDDGCSHYCLSVLADVDAAGAVQEDWNALFQSFGVSSY